MSERNSHYRIPVLLIVGMGHSGSTLLDLLLGAHSQIHGAGELARVKKDFHKRKCSCGARAAECPVWKHVFKDFDEIPDLRAGQTKKDFLKNNNCFKTRMKNRDLSEYLTTMERTYRNILNTTGKTAVLDSSKGPERANALLKNPNLDITIIHLVRDGRGVAWSYRKKARRLWPCLRKWCTKNLMAEVLKRRGKRTVRMHYKDLARNPEKELTRILNTAGFQFEGQMMDFRGVEQHQVGGNRMRLEGSGKIKEDTAWRHNLPLTDRLIVNSCVGWLNTYYNIRRRL